jgi:hypothetical protein
MLFQSMLASSSAHILKQTSSSLGLPLRFLSRARCSGALSRRALPIRDRKLPSNRQKALDALDKRQFLGTISSRRIGLNDDDRA